MKKWNFINILSIISIVFLASVNAIWFFEDSKFIFIVNSIVFLLMANTIKSFDVVDKE